jgi:hypothetical protein
MALSDRAVAILRKGFDQGAVDEGRIRAVLRCEHADVSSIEPYLDHELPEVREAASRVVAAKGDPNLVIQRVAGELKGDVQMTMLNALGKRGGGRLEDLAFLLHEDEWEGLREAAMDMYRAAGREDCLMPLLLSTDDSEIDMAKRCINEQERRAASDSGARG